MVVFGSVVGAAQLISALERLDGGIGQAVGRAMARTAAGGEGIMKGKASGRPGPRVITGDFRRSIVGQVIGVSGGVWSIQIGSNAPQAARLEYGFSGPDILGRVFDQPPFPYAGPSAPAILQLGGDQVLAEVSKVLGAA
jgi:hypothetical protein